MIISINIRPLTGDQAADNATAGGAVMSMRHVLCRYVVYLLACSYVLMLCSPVLPAMADAVAHTFWEKQHMLTVHEVNGKFHVHNEIAKNEKRSGKEKPVSYKCEVEACVQPLSLHAATQLPMTVKDKPFAGYSCYYPSCYTGSNYPPPKMYV